MIGDFDDSVLGTIGNVSRIQAPPRAFFLLMKRYINDSFECIQGRSLVTYVAL